MDVFLPSYEVFSGEGNGNPLQYSCLEKLMDREAWWATVQGVVKSQTPLSNLAHEVFNTGHLTSLGLKLTICDVKSWLLIPQSYYGGNRGVYI